MKFRVSQHVDTEDVDESNLTHTEVVFDKTNYPDEFCKEKKTDPLV